MGLHRRYAALLGGTTQEATLALDSFRDRLAAKFRGMMKALFATAGAAFRVEIVADPAVQEFIGAHSAVLDSSFEKVPMSDIMRRRLSQSNYVFSGMKAFHELHEALPSLLDENGERKPFERFLNDVRSIDATYNANYLRAEYNFVAASAQMAARWEEFAKDGDRYNLQYRTQRDDKVRAEHEALDRVTLPMSDPFWEQFMPPNGWNCRCTVVQVLKSKYDLTPHDEAMRLGEEALQRDTKGMFRFNPGISGKAVPDYNPYTLRRCRDCDIAKGKLKLARFIPDNEVCAACRYIRQCENQYEVVPTSAGKVRLHSKHGINEKAENITIAKYFAEKYGHEIDLLPNPDNQKSADVLNHTLGFEQEYKVNTRPTKGAIDNELRKAAKQADHIVLRIDSGISLGDLRNGLCGRLNRCINVKDVTIIKDGKDATYSRANILKADFQIKQEDFK